MTIEINKIMIVRAVISKLKEENKPVKIEAKDLAEYESPDKIFSRQLNEDVIPDIAAHYKERINLYEVELNNDLNIEKWKLLLAYAKNQKGHLFLVVPDYMKEKVKRELKEHDFNAGLIYFQSG